MEQSPNKSNDCSFKLINKARINAEMMGKTQLVINYYLMAFSNDDKC